MRLSTEQEVHAVEPYIITCLINELQQNIPCLTRKNRLIFFNRAIRCDSVCKVRPRNQLIKVMFTREIFSMILYNFKISLFFDSENFQATCCNWCKWV